MRLEEYFLPKMKTVWQIPTYRFIYMLNGRYILLHKIGVLLCEKQRLQLSVDKKASVDGSDATMR